MDAEISRRPVRSGIPIQRGIDRVGSIGSSHDDNIGTSFDSIHKGKQLRDDTFFDFSVRQQIREKMDLIDLEEDMIDPEVLDALGGTPIRSRYLEPLCPPRNCRRSAHCYLGRYWWLGQSQAGVSGVAGDSAVPSGAPRKIPQIWHVAVSGRPVLWPPRYW